MIRVYYLNGPSLSRDYNLRRRDLKPRASGPIHDGDIEHGETTFREAGAKIEKLMQSVEEALNQIPNDGSDAQKHMEAALVNLVKNSVSARTRRTMLRTFKKKASRTVPSSPRRQASSSRT